MITFDRIVTMIILLLVFIHTTSYGSWTWKKKNKLGGAAIFLVALAAIALPIYSIFFKEG